MGPYTSNWTLSACPVAIFIDKGGQPNAQLSPLVKPLGLTGEEKSEFLAFIQSLNGDKHPVDPPDRLP